MLCCGCAAKAIAPQVGRVPRVHKPQVPDGQDSKSPINSICLRPDSTCPVVWSLKESKKTVNSSGTCSQSQQKPAEASRSQQQPSPHRRDNRFTSSRCIDGPPVYPDNTEPCHVCASTERGLDTDLTRSRAKETKVINQTDGLQALIAPQHSPNTTQRGGLGGYPCHVMLCHNQICIDVVAWTRRRHLAKQRRWLSCELDENTLSWNINTAVLYVLIILNCLRCWTENTAMSRCERLPNAVRTGSNPSPCQDATNTYISKWSPRIRCFVQNSPGSTEYVLNYNHQIYQIENINHQTKLVRINDH